MTIGCPECGALEDIPPLGPRMLARCRICHYPLERRSGRSITASFACAVTTFVLLFPANLAPLMTVHMLGTDRSSVLASGIVSIWRDGWLALALLLGALGIVLPFVRFGLLTNLLPRLPAGAFVFPDAPAPAGTRTLVVTVLDCNASGGGTLTLQVAWTLLSGQPARTTLSEQAAHSAQVEGHDAAAQAAALSRVLGELADRIAASIAVR